MRRVLTETTNLSLFLSFTLFSYKTNQSFFCHYYSRRQCVETMRRGSLLEVNSLIDLKSCYTAIDHYSNILMSQLCSSTFTCFIGPVRGDCYVCTTCEGERNFIIIVILHVHRVILWTSDLINCSTGTGNCRHGKVNIHQHNISVNSLGLIIVVH